MLSRLVRVFELVERCLLALLVMLYRCRVRRGAARNGAMRLRRGIGLAVAEAVSEEGCGRAELAACAGAVVPGRESWGR